MILATLLSAAALVAGLSGFLLLDCSSSTVNIVGGDPVQLCAALVDLGIQPASWMGIGLMVVGVLALVAIWMPTAERRRVKKDIQSIDALQKNLARVPGTTLRHLDDIEEPATETEQSPDTQAALVELVADLRRAFESDDTDEADLRATWIATLRLCNDLHNSGEIETAQFKKLNTGLLELMSPSGRRSPEPATARA